MSWLAERSGGLYSFVSDSEALNKLYQQYGRALQSEYAITYVSPSALRDGINVTCNVSFSTAGVSTETNYNPGGVLPEVSSNSWTLFAWIMAGLLLLLVIPFIFGSASGLLSGIGKQGKGRIKLAQPTPAGKRPNIKIK